MIKASANFGPSRSSRQASRLVPLSTLIEATGLCANTLRTYANEGRLPSYRSGPGGHRRFPLSECLEALGLKLAGDEGNEGQSIPVAIYARTSGAKQAVGFDTAKGESRDGQESDLSRQVQRLKAYAKEKYGVEGTLYSDVGSGLSFTRKSFLRLTKDILSRRYEGGVLIVTFKDRLVRWGLELLETICEQCGVRIEFCEDEPEKTDEKELTEDLLNILHIFSCKSYAKRSALRTTKKMGGDVIERAMELQREGLPITAVTEQLNREGFKATDGAGHETPLSRFQVSKYLRNDLVKQVVLDQEEESNLERFWRENIDWRAEKNPTARTSFADVYRRFTQWASQTGCRKLTQYTVSNFMKSKGVERRMFEGRVRYVGLRLV